MASSDPRVVELLQEIDRMSGLGMLTLDMQPEAASIHLSLRLCDRTLRGRYVERVSIMRAILIALVLTISSTGGDRTSSSLNVSDFSLELSTHRRRLCWEATPRSIHEGVAHAIQLSDCLAFDTPTAQLFAGGPCVVIIDDSTSCFHLLFFINWCCCSYHVFF